MENANGREKHPKKRWEGQIDVWLRSSESIFQIRSGGAHNAVGVLVGRQSPLLRRKADSSENLGKYVKGVENGSET